MRTTLALLALAAMGCSNNLEALYAQGGAAGGDSPARAELPLLPALPDQGRRDACEACAAMECADERADCLDDDPCSELLGCRGTCDNPPCLRACNTEHGFSPWFDELDACVWNRCAADCGSGDNFACTGVYALPPVEQERFRVELWFDQALSSFTARTELDFLAGAEVRACDGGSPGCEPPQYQAKVGADDRVTLDVPRALLAGFQGYFEVEQPEFWSHGARERLFFPPTSTSVIYRTQFVPLQSLPQLEGLNVPDPDLPTLDPDQARIVLYPRDCTDRRVISNACFELVGESATVVYGVQAPSNAGLSPPTTDCTNFEIIGTIGNLPEGAYHVRGTVGESVTYERRSIFARPGWTTHVYLDPLPR